MSKEFNGHVVHYVRSVGGHPAIAVLDMAIKAEQASNRYSDINSPNWDSEAVYIANSVFSYVDPVVAAMSFSRNKWDATIRIGWAFVLPAFREEGRHTAMFEAVKYIAIRDGYREISRTVLAGNASMERRVIAQGGRRTASFFRHTLKTPLTADLKDTLEL